MPTPIEAPPIHITATTPTPIHISIPVGAPGPPGADGQAQLAAHEAADDPHPQYQRALSDQTLTFGVVPVTSLGLVKGVVGEIRVNVLEPFNDPVASFSIGDTTDPQRLLGNSQIVLDQLGIASVNPSVDLGTTGVQINAYISAGQSTTGKLKIVIYEG